jgi:hypothetical protein
MGKHEAVRHGAAIETTEAERCQMQAQRKAAEGWSRWAQEVGDRLVAVERRTFMYLGHPANPSDSVLAMVIGEEQQAAEEKLAAAIEALRKEQAIELALCRDEILSRLDRKIFGATLDYDPEAVRRAIFEARTEIKERAASLDAKLSEMAERHKAAERHRRDQLVRVVRLEAVLKGLPPPPIVIREWKIEEYQITPIMSDGSVGPTLDIYPVLRQLADDLTSTRS